MDTFESLGVQVRRSTETRSLDVGGIRSEREFTVTTVVLPRDPRVQAKFSSEGIGGKLVKLFRKEVQVGDKTFDDAVYVSTGTPTETEAFLRSEDIQSTILACVTTGGTIEIDGREVKVRASGSDTDEDPAIVRLVRALLA